MEAYPEAAAILAAAGWKPHDGWNVYTRDTLVMGFQPDGLAFHVKNWASIQEGHPQWNADTPDTAEEAAAWLVERFKPNPLTTEATLEPLALQSEEVETPKDESNGETGEAQSDENSGALGAGRDELGADGDLSVRLPSGLGDLDARSAEGVDASSDVYAEHERAEPDLIDADFTIEDLGGQDDHADLILEGGDPWTAPELPAPEPEDFAPDEIKPERESDQARFYGLDDLGHVRSLRIGDVATEALRLTTMIEEIVSEQEGEFATIQAYVVSNLDKHTGAFTPQDDASKQTYGRFLELSSARSKIALIDTRRKDATAFLIKASRDEVVSFDVEAAFA